MRSSWERTAARKGPWTFSSKFRRRFCSKSYDESQIAQNIRLATAPLAAGGGRLRRPLGGDLLSLPAKLLRPAVPGPLGGEAAAAFRRAAARRHAHADFGASGAVPGESASRRRPGPPDPRSEEHTSELQSQSNLVCRLLL